MEKTNKKYTPKYTLSDGTILQIREMIQQSMLLGANLVDNLRAMILESDSNNKLVLSREYVESWNRMIQEIKAKAEERLKEEEEEEENKKEVS